MMINEDMLMQKAGELTLQAVNLLRIVDMDEMEGTVEIDGIDYKIKFTMTQEPA